MLDTGKSEARAATSFAGLTGIFTENDDDLIGAASRGHGFGKPAAVFGIHHNRIRKTGTANFQNRAFRIGEIDTGRLKGVHHGNCGIRLAHCTPITEGRILVGRQRADQRDRLTSFQGKQVVVIL